MIRKNLMPIEKIADSVDVCLDVGSGTGNLTRFELPIFRSVIAADISTLMLKKLKKKLGSFSNLQLVRCDAENLPFRGCSLDCITMFSVLHHLPHPFESVRTLCKCLKKGGVLYIHHEPNHRKCKRVFDFLNQVMTLLVCLCLRSYLIRSNMPNLDYSLVDIHPEGFHVIELSNFLKKLNLSIIVARSYCWLSPIGFPGQLLSRVPKAYHRLIHLIFVDINRLIEKMPLSSKLGRAILIIAKKTK